MSETISNSNGGSGRGKLMAMLLNQARAGTATDDSSSVVGNGSGRAVGGRGRKVIELTAGLAAPPVQQQQQPPPQQQIIAALKSRRIAAAYAAAVKRKNDIEMDETSSTDVSSAETKIENLSISSDPLSETASTASPEPLMNVIKKSGTYGKPIGVLTNYMRLSTDPNRGVFEYDCRFEPFVHEISLRYRLLERMSDTIGSVKSFDGCTLFLPVRLPSARTVRKIALESPITGQETVYEVRKY